MRYVALQAFLAKQLKLPRDHRRDAEQFGELLEALL
jgi:hypothetical protein